MSIPILSRFRTIAQHYDGFILDLWGVIHDGAMPYPGAADSLAGLNRLGKPTVLLSNSPRRAQSLVEMMAGMGIDRHLYGHVMSSGEAVHSELLTRTDPWFAALGRRCLHMGPERDRPLFDGLALEQVTAVADADFVLNTGPDGVEETLQDYRPLLDAAGARRLPMICANPDLVVMTLGRSMICAGTLARYYEEIGGRVRYCGKPDPAIYATCLALLGIADKRRVLAVGDSFATDVAGAAAAGLDCLFCSGGIHAAELGTRYGQSPDPARLDALVAVFHGLTPVAAIGGLIW